MAIRFSEERWQVTRWNYEQWWAGRLARPLLNFTIRGGAADRPEPRLPDHWLTAKYDPSVPAEAIRRSVGQYRRPASTAFPYAARRLRAAGAKKSPRYHP